MVGAPVKWVEDRSENLMATAFARDYHMHGEIAATRDGRITGLRVRVLADHGAFNATAQPSRFPAGFFHIFTGSYDVPAAHCRVTGVHTNKAPGGVAYACSFRVTEASYLVERLVDVLAHDLGLDPAELRMRNLLRPEQFPYRCATGWEYDSGDYPRTLALALEMVGYDELRKRAGERGGRAGDGPLLGIGISFFTEAVGAGPRALMDIAGLGMADGAQLRVHPSGSAVLAVSCMSQGQGHETTFAQLVAHELGIGVDEVEVVQGDTDRTPFGLGTYGSRSTPVSGAATVVVARKVRERARLVAAAMLEVAPDDLEWVSGRFQVRGVPGTGASLREIALAAHSDLELPDGVEGHLDAHGRLQPAQPDLPVRRLRLRRRRRPGHRAGRRAPVRRRRRLRGADQPDDRRGPDARRARGRHRDGADGADRVRRAGNHLGASFMDYLLPTSLECPIVGAGGDRDALAAPPGRRQGRRRVGDGRLARRGGERRARRDRGAARRHAAHPGAGVAGRARGARCGPIWRSGDEPMRADLLARVDGLRTRRTPFVLATVVRAERPTSAKPGDCAVVTADGTLDGFVGGVCAESTVRVGEPAAAGGRRVGAAADHPGRRARRPHRTACGRSATRACPAARWRSSWRR